MIEVGQIVYAVTNTRATSAVAVKTSVEAEDASEETLKKGEYLLKGCVITLDCRSTYELVFASQTDMDLHFETERLEASMERSDFRGV